LKYFLVDLADDIIVKQMILTHFVV